MRHAILNDDYPVTGIIRVPVSVRPKARALVYFGGIAVHKFVLQTLI